MCFSSYKNRKLKVKLLLWAVAHEIKKRTFFVLFYFVCFCILSQCIVFWIHFLNIHTLTYQKTLLYKLLLLVFKIVENSQYILNFYYFMFALTMSSWSAVVVEHDQMVLLTKISFRHHVTTDIFNQIVQKIIHLRWDNRLHSF